VLTFVHHRASVTIPEVLEDGLLIALSVQDKRAQMRVATILQVAGWSKKQVWDRNTQTSAKRWVPQASEDAEGG